jgi:hypothetical protein
MAKYHDIRKKAFYKMLYGGKLTSWEIRTLRLRPFFGNVQKMDKIVGGYPRSRTVVFQAGYIFNSTIQGA